MPQNSTLYLIDISNFIFRAFYAVRSLTAPDKTPVNAVYGVFTMLLRLIEEKKPEYLLIAQDSKEKSFRVDMFQNYKANRSAPPDELKPQFAILEELFDQLKIPRLRVAGIEADDIIASFAEQLKNQFSKVVIVSGDKDLLQLVDGKVEVWESTKEKIYHREDVKEKLGVYPEQVVDYLALVGDSSDNVPGVTGIGDKGAQKLIAEFGTLENIYASLGQVKNVKSFKALSDSHEDAFLSKKLVTVKKDLVLPFSAQQLKYQFSVHAPLLDFLRRLGFKSQVLKLGPLMEQKVSTTQDEAPEIGYFFSLHQWNSEEEKELSLSFFNQEIFLKSHKQFYRSSVSNFCSFVEAEKFQKALLFAQDSKGFFRSVPELSSLSCFKSFCPTLFDIGLAQFILEENIYQPFKEDKNNLVTDSIIQESLNHLWTAGQQLLPQIKEQNFSDLFFHLDSPLNYVLFRMEAEGIKLDLEFLKTCEVSFLKQLEQIETSVQQASGGMNVNLKSPKQVATLLFEKLNLPIIKMNKTGPSTDSSVLDKLQSMQLSSIPGLLLKYREIEKLLSTYVTTLPTMIDANYRVHTTFRQNVAATGRLSSDSPNLQNIPVKTENGRLIRKAFVARPGHLFVSADYSQIELRILAHFSQDPFMLKAFQENIDIHTMTAAEVFRVPREKVSSEQRSRAKAINFGLLYGQTSFGLSDSLNISQGEARLYIKHYFERFSKVKSYLDHLKEKAMQTGFSETLLGRKRKIPHINSQNRLEKTMAERVAINSPIQGTAADIIKRAMLVVQDFLETQNLKSKLILQIHDELLLECPEAEVPLVKEKVAKIMESTVLLTVPLHVDVGVGKNWSEV